MKIFVYGTLKRGYDANIRYLQKAKFIGEAKTTNEYSLYDLVQFPAMIKDGKSNGVYGELYEITEDPDKTISNMDFYEGHPNFFVRSLVELSDGSTAIGYLFLSKAEEYSLIENGKWEKI